MLHHWQEVSRSCKRRRSWFSPRDCKEGRTANMFILPRKVYFPFWSSQLWDDTFLLFQATKFMAICYSAKGNKHSLVPISSAKCCMASSDAWNNHLETMGTGTWGKTKTEEQWADEERLQPPRKLSPLGCMWCKIMYGGRFCDLWPKKKTPSCTITVSCSQPTSALQSHLVMLNQFREPCYCVQLCPTHCNPTD